MTTDDLNDRVDKMDKLTASVFSTPNGKKLLEYFVDEFCDRISVVKGDSHMTYFKEGQRSIVSMIVNIIKEQKDGG